MITKPSLRISLAAIVTAAMLLFSQCGTKVADQDGIISFLNLVNLQIKDKQVEALLKNFDMPKRRAAIVQLTKVLCNLNSLDKGSKPIFKTEMDLPAAELQPMTNNVTIAKATVVFSRDSLSSQSSTLSFKIKKGTNNKYKIIEVEATKFAEEYVSYQNYVHSETLTDADIYSPQTLAAFKTAEGLKAKYDSIPWFQHVDGKTWFYVQKKRNPNESYEKGSEPERAFYMGLVDPDQKEIIPVAYDMIHNISISFPGLIEVELGDKRGFYNIAGELVLPVEYEQILPLTAGGELALLRKGGSYFWWHADHSVSDEDLNVKIAEVMPRIKGFGKFQHFDEKTLANIMEFNDRFDHTSLYVTPTYLVDLGLMSRLERFKNPLRKNIDYEDGIAFHELKFDKEVKTESWLSSIFYSIKEDYLGGRGGLYERKNVLLVDQKRNKLYGQEVTSYLGEMDGDIDLTGLCAVSKLKPINDSLYEVIVGTGTYRQLYNGEMLSGAPCYHYLSIKGDKLEELEVNRLFGFTKYVKMDDSYLNACYLLGDKMDRTTKVTPEMLRYMKNEIYAEYKYEFKDKKWAEVFNQNPEYTKLNANVDDSLTVIDKFNIDFINKKLQQQPAAKPKVLAAK